MGLEKGGIEGKEGVVIENGGLGVRGGVGGGMLRMGLKRGGVGKKVVVEEGGKMLFGWMCGFNENWESWGESLEEVCV